MMTSHPGQNINFKMNIHIGGKYFSFFIYKFKNKIKTNIRSINLDNNHQKRNLRKRKYLNIPIDTDSEDYSDYDE